MLNRTPPRRSPRLCQNESETPSGIESTPAGFESVATHSAASHATVEGAIVSTNNATNFTQLADPATAVSNDTLFQPISSTASSATSIASFPGAHAVAPEVQTVLQSMQKQIAALERQLKNAEERLREGDIERQRLLQLPLKNTSDGVSVTPPSSEALNVTNFPSTVTPADSNVTNASREHVANMPPSNKPPTNMPPANMPPSNMPPSNTPPSNTPPSNMPPSNTPPSNTPPSNMPPSNKPPSNMPPSNMPPSNIPLSNIPPSNMMSSYMPPSITTSSNMLPSNMLPANMISAANTPSNVLPVALMPTNTHRLYFQPSSMPSVSQTSAQTYSDTQSPLFNNTDAAARTSREPNTTSASNFASSWNVPRKVQDLPDFSGQPEDWPIFYTSFLESNAVYNYSNFENNQRLNKCLKGVAKELVKSLLIHPDNVTAVIEQLQFRFGRSDQLIRSQMKLVRDVTPISEVGVMRIIQFATLTKNLAVFLKAVNGEQHLANPTLLDELVGKLPMSKKMEWARCAANIKPYPTVQHFSDWLNDVANIICIVQDSEPRELRRRPVLHAAERQHASPLKCSVCQGQHKVVECQRILNANISERWSEVKRRRLCFTCLNIGHLTRDCRRGKPCSIDGCQKRHHKLLHEHVPQTSGEAVLSCATNAAESKKLLFRVLPVTLFGLNKRVDTYALLDEGSSVTMMDSLLMQELGLKGKRQQLSIQWLGGRAAQETTDVVNVFISGVGKCKKHMLRNVYSISDLKLPMQSLHESDLRDDCRSLELPTQPYSNVTPQLLIGLDHCHLGLPSTTLRLTKDGPYAANTELGWVIFGPTNGSQPESASCLHVSLQNELQLHNLVAEYFETENFGVKASPPITSSADLRAKEILEATTKRVENRFQTGLLWKSDAVNLPDSYAMALKRLISIERKMKQDSNFGTAYNGIIERYVQRNYARKLEPAEAAITGAKTWYLPHFAVVNPNKPAKIRLVFDAAAEVNGVSLNTQLLKGPQQYRPLAAILFHFREGAVAVCGDIREMFHQILIQPDDRSSQRFLWRGADGGRPPDIYEMMVMTFGAACSPCSAHHIKTVNALEHQNRASRAVKAVLDYHYVDDFVDSFETTAQAIEISKQVRDIHFAAGFELRNFSSNSPEVIGELGGSESNLSIKCKDSLASEKVLGMFWQPTSDEFKYELKFNYVDKGVLEGSRVPTKRELLSIVMSIFDPLGFLCHVTVSAKLLLREVWKRSVSWDEPLPSDVNVGWQRFRQHMTEVIHCRIPRFYFKIGVPRELQLHVFVDASEDAFAAVAYWRIVNTKEEVELAFVSAKVKSAPLKPLTIPRLELQAAVLGTRLMVTILQEHSVNIDSCVLWSDSRTVTNWIKSEHHRYKPFVAHRVAEILAASAPVQWRWLPTNENIADKATRASRHIDVSPTSRWFLGPEFLLYDEEYWPKPLANTQAPDDDEEIIRPKILLLAVSKHTIDFTKFSSFARLKRTAGWVIRFIERCRKCPRDNQQYGLTAAELDAAERFLCRLVQREIFAEELMMIEVDKPPPPKSLLFNLSPYIDELGVLRVSGRIDAASWLPYDSKRPIILPPGHYFTKLLVHHEHQRMHHQNIEATIHAIRSKFWIPRLRQVLRSVISDCFVCKASKAMPVTPLMGSLPKDRLTPYVRPFTFTGVDYFGPLSVAVGRRTEKRWVALFTCLTVRAIHLEVAHDLSTDSCIIAIRNFINRRGVPARMRSDNGKNFIGADNEAKRFSEVFDCERIQSEVSSKGVEWIFNWPCNPSEGGIWEIMVKCVKRVLRHTVKETVPREHTLTSFIIEAENVVNSRPLTHMPISADQEEPLTPNHFLLGSANTANTPVIEDTPVKYNTLRKQWRIARQLRDRFWKRWIAEYLPTLTRRAKWCQPAKALKEGDLVFICDVSMPRREWCRGRVEKVYAASDGVIRRADVRTAKGLLRRATSKLAVLDLNDGEAGRSTGEGMLQNDL